ncbi:amidase [Variovorax sp. J2P1-59]|uniref:amidase n=1 Tax=Variovorax flavidus TaxID=3053501 RepID=UPI0025749C04|nr:amidase [Variovorax sp. J2P1-59]MDM0078736.1 amidase [Variovorax sp. J2P1-59]
MSSNPDFGNGHGIDIDDAGVAQLAALIRRGELGVVELVENRLADLERRGARTNAFASVNHEQALAQAREADIALTRGASVGPLHGVPIAVKDNVLTPGFGSSAASGVLAGAPLQGDAPLVAQLRAAGAIVVAKTNMHEWAYGATNTSSHHGPTRNPWDLRAITGGSSGGSAACVAEGLLPMAVGTDTGGSIRIPSAACGISGIKPGTGRVNGEGVLPLAWSFDAAGPMARSAEDLWVGLDAMLPAAAGASARHAAQFRAARAQARVRIGVLVGEGFETARDVGHAFDEALQVFRQRGATLVPVPVRGMGAVFAAWKAIMYAEASTFHRQFIGAAAERYTPEVRALLHAGESVSAVDYLAAQQFRAAFGESFAREMAGLAALALPTLPVTAPPLAESQVEFAGRTTTTQDAMTAMPCLANFTGLPAVSVPSGQGDSGLPVGLTLMGHPGGEFALLGLAAAYQDDSTWHAMRPKRYGAVATGEAAHVR